jgi:two-component system cell cycle sensor histidine kinase/response regulator CckA
VSKEPIKVLIIDDDQTDRAIFKRYLQTDRSGRFEFCEESSGVSGLKACDSFVPDCVLLDYRLPDMDGLTVLRHLGRGTNNPAHAVVMLTAIGSEQIAVEGMKLGLMDYLAKNPTNMDMLPRTIENAVRKFNLERKIATQHTELEERNRALEVAQEALQHEKEKYRTLTEAIPQLVWSASPGKLVHYANQRFLEYSGYATNSSWRFASLVHPDDLSEFEEAWSAAAAAGGVIETEIRLKRASDDTYRWHLIRAVPVFGLNGRLDNWFGTCTDIENQKRNEEAVRRQQKFESIGLLAGGIAHDFNNLLVGIMGGTSFALQTIDAEHPAYAMLNVAVRASERAAHLVQQLLAYAGKGRFLVEPVNLSTLLMETRDLLHASIPKSVALELLPDAEVPAIEANSGQLQQLIMNLILNAAEAIDDRGGEVKARTFVKDIHNTEDYCNALGYAIAAGRYIGLEVSDNGCGMDADTRTRIFEPFFTTKFTGRGLGLAAVQGIVRSLHGLIDVGSTPGLGSTFTILIPAREIRGSATAGISRAAKPAGRGGILVIDDEEVVRTTTNAVLRKAGYKVLMAEDGDSGIEMLRSRRSEVDLILLDMSMPGKSGIQVLSEIRLLDPLIPVLIASGYSEDQVAKRFEGTRISGILQKPFTSTRLVESVATALVQHD